MFPFDHFPIPDDEMLAPDGEAMANLPLILIVEDEYLLAAEVEEALTDAGFATETVSSGEQALALLTSGNKGHSALVTDVTLAGSVNGWEVARLVREKEPSFPIVYVTAHDREWPSSGVPNSIVVSKPFAPAQIVTAVSTLLNNVTPPTSG
jgi:DNA-binding response OmpR family regulator